MIEKERKYAQEQHEVTFVVDAHALVDPCPVVLQPRARWTLSAPHSHYSTTVDQPRARILANKQNNAMDSQDNDGHTSARSGCISCNDGTSRIPPSASLSTPSSPTTYATAIRGPRLTSGRIIPHLLHLDTAARVTFASWLQRTPVSALYFADRRFLAHTNPVRPLGFGSRGGSSANPGGTVQTR